MLIKDKTNVINYDSLANCTAKKIETKTRSKLVKTIKKKRKKKL